MEKVLRNGIDAVLFVQNWINDKFTRMSTYCCKNRKASIALSVLLLLALLVVMYLLNRHTTLIVDDYGYSFNYEGRRFTSLQEVFIRLWHHYFEWGGRVVVHFIAIVFLWAGKPIFDIFNTFAFLGMVCMMYYLAIGNWPCGKKNYPMVLLGTFFMLFAFTPAFGQDFLWLVGASNYLWGLLMFLLMLLPFRKQLFQKYNVFANPLYCPLFFIGSVVAGWTNENMGVTLVVLIIAFILIYWWNERTIYAWTIWALIGAILGAGFLILAPGNFVRLHTEGGGLTLHFFRNFLDITKILLKPGFLLIPFCLFGIFRCFSCNVEEQKKVIVSDLFLFASLISAYAMIASPYFTDRARLGTLVLGIIACMSVYPYLVLDSKKYQKITALVAVIVLALLASDIKAGYKDIVAYEKRDMAKVAYTLQQKEKGNMDIILPKNYPSTKYCAAWGLEDISENTKHWTNTGYARYFGVKTVRTVK